MAANVTSQNSRSLFQVAQAGSSNDRLPQGSGVKRKSASSTRAPPASPGDCKFKRLREIVSQSDTEVRTCLSFRGNSSNNQ